MCHGDRVEQEDGGCMKSALNKARRSTEMVDWCALNKVQDAWMMT